MAFSKFGRNVRFLRFAVSLIGFCVLISPPLRAEVPPPSAKVAKPVPMKPFEPMDPAVALAKANAYFNNATTMIGDFVQIGADGRRTEGKLYIQRPGRMRFEYAPPATLEVVADGLSVAVHDKKTAAKDIYFISETPLKFLLKDKVDLTRDVKVVDVRSEPGLVTIVIEDQATFGGTSTIKLLFDPDKFNLKQWQVTDPQGYETTVSLFNIDFTTRPDPSLFQLSQERIPNTNN